MYSVNYVMWPFVCYPGMVNNSSIDWFFPWPEQALYAVASVFISPDVSLYIWEDDRDNIFGDILTFFS